MVKTDGLQPVMTTASDVQALRNAICRGELAQVKQLVSTDRGLLHSVLVPGENRRYRPLTLAAVQCQLPILEFVIGEGCSVIEDDNYPMFRAALYNECVSALELLVRQGAEVNGVWADYGPPLIATCEYPALVCMEWLLDHGAHIAGRGQGASRLVEWDAVVHAAQVHDEHPELLECLLRRGGQVTGHEHGDTALHVVAKRGNIAGVRLLLERGADPDAQDANGRRPIDLTTNHKIRDLLQFQP